MKKILIAAGGTGGHLFPAQQLAKKLEGEFEILFAGHSLETSPFFQKENIPFQEIEAHPLKKGFLRGTWKGFIEARQLLFRNSPDLVVGFGSYHTIPILLAAAIYRKKLLLFEANASLGRVNRLFRMAATAMAVQFPIKNGILVNWLPWISQARGQEAHFELDKEKTTLLVFGGSQGASFLNDIAPLIVKKLSWQVIHLTGPKEEVKVREAYKKLGVAACVKAFEHQMDLAYKTADVVLCRSGAGTIAELIHYELPAVLVPYPYAGHHQKKNGEFFAECTKGVKVILQQDATVDRMTKELAEVKEMKIDVSCLKKDQRSDMIEVIRRILK